MKQQSCRATLLTPCCRSLCFGTVVKLIRTDRAVALPHAGTHYAGVRIFPAARQRFAQVAICIEASTARTGSIRDGVDSCSSYKAYQLEVLQSLISVACSFCAAPWPGTMWMSGS